MADNENNPQVVPSEYGDRPRIARNPNPPKFERGEQVWIVDRTTSAKRGPFFVSSNEGGVYKLCDTVDYGPVENDREFAEDDLEFYTSS